MRRFEDIIKKYKYIKIFDKFLLLEKFSGIN